MSLGIETRTAQVKSNMESVKKSSASVNDERGELERRCTQALLSLLPRMRQIINHEREGDSSSITVQQYSVLKVLQERKFLISELADKLKVSRPTMSRIIDGLEGRRRPSTNGNGTGEEHHRPKLVERIACDDDHRLVYAQITEEGEAVLRHYRHQAEESIISVLRDVPPEQLSGLLHGLETLAHVVEFKN